MKRNGPASRDGRLPIAEHHGRLAVLDAQLCDKRGEAVALRGLSLFWGQYQPRFFNKDLVGWLATRWNVQIIRVPIGVTDARDAARPADLVASACSVIDAAIDAGIYVLVDWHAHDPFPNEAADCLGGIARSYGDQPHILYELWNEPRPTHDWHATIKPYHRQVLKRVRQAAPNAVCVLSTRGFCTELEEAAADPLDADNIAYALHFYAGTHRLGLRTRVEVELAKGLPIFVSEWGLGEANGNGTRDAEEAGRWLRFLDERGISSINWAISDKDETCSIVVPSARSDGQWRRSQLTPSGQFVRDWLRARSGPPLSPLQKLRRLFD